MVNVSHSAKLKPDEVCAIRSTYYILRGVANDTTIFETLADEYTVSVKTIRSIIKRLTWRGIAEVEDPMKSMKFVFSDRLMTWHNSHNPPLTDKQAAELCGICRSWYIQLKNGYRDPSVATVVMIAKNTGLSVDWLLGLIDNKAPVQLRNK